MSKKEYSEKRHDDIANRIYSEIKNLDSDLFRLFRVYHPVYEISVNIDVAQEDETYHIIEKHMDKLVCGYLGNDRPMMEGIYIKDRKELFELMGIDRQAYEIADCFYEDLIADGHFRETAEGILGLHTARESVKHQKRYTLATNKERKLFDQFSARLLPQYFYDCSRYACKRKTRVLKS